MIFFQILRNNERLYSSIGELKIESKDNTLEEEWNRTAALVVQGSAQIFTNYFATIRSSPHFSSIWKELLSCLEHLLNRKDLAVSTSVFKGLTQIFEELDSIQAIGSYSIDEAWRIWKDFNPVCHLGDSSLKDGNQTALMAYLRCFAQIYRLIDHDTRNSYAENAMPRLYNCLENAHLPAYSSDVDRATPVQQGVLENLKLIPTDRFDVLSARGLGRCYSKTAFQTNKTWSTVDLCSDQQVCYRSLTIEGPEQCRNCILPTSHGSP